MSLLDQNAIPDGSSAPRVSGDEPKIGEMMGVLGQCSPRERG